MVDRRLLAFFASVAILVGAAGYLLAQNRAGGTTVQAAPVTLLPPASATTTTSTTQPAASTVRSTLPPTRPSEVFSYAAGDGCTPGSQALPDGRYYGSVAMNEDRTFSFNLKCLFLAGDLPEDFDEIFERRFPGEAFPATGFDLIDPSSAERTVRFAWNGEMVFNGLTYVGDEAYLGFLAGEEQPFDAVIELELGVAVTITELVSPVNPS